MRTKDLKRTQRSAWATGRLTPPEDMLAPLFENTVGDAVRNAEANTESLLWLKLEGPSELGVVARV